MKTSRMIRTGALLLTTLMLITSCDLCTLFGLDYDKGNDVQTTPHPSEEETKEPGYFYSLGNTGNYLTIDAVELIPDENKLIAVDKEGKEESIDLIDNKYKSGRVTITVTIEPKERITLTRSDKDPLIYTYEE